MLVSKSLDINLLRSEKKTLFRFLALYTLLTIIIVGVFSFIYYEFQKDLMLQKKRVLLEEYSREFIQDLKYLHINFDKTQTYPRTEKYSSAIFDNYKNKIFSTTKNKINLNKILSLDNGMVQLVSIPESYYLGAKYIVIQIKDDAIWSDSVQKEILIYAFLAFVFMFLVGYFLLQLFLKPMKDALELLDKFIKDTTHELNTPVSTIVTNIEMIDRNLLDEKLARKINRIDIGAKTISNIYQDLTYITLGNKIISKDEDIGIADVVLQRVEYFQSLVDAKKITLTTEIEDKPLLFIDKAKFSKLLDNLISNAIKYNKLKGTINIKVLKKSIIVEDSGIGISKINISKMQDRYARFNDSCGGFGIGLNIVSAIAKEYDLKIDITSKEKEWTKVSVSW
ncbi:MAG: HAMP domain-containing sensor histidine kinase [Campylobacterota bacterium]|nr:HAMP domain-containing sensor histidine kinase [Campylobacterota bacterium]